MSCLIKLRQINKTYPSPIHNVHVLKDINLDIAAGEMLAIVGASGSGKSTLMHIMGLLDSPTTGSYKFQNKEVANLSDSAKACIRNEKIGFVFQAFFLLPRLNALQNVVLPLFYRGIQPQVAEQKGLAMLEKFGMEKFSHQKPQTLSGGQQQRVAIARALVGDPAVVFADEPTGALDSHTGSEVLALFKKLHQEEARTFIIITHDASISKACERIVHIRDGKIENN